METSFSFLQGFMSDAHTQIHPHPHGSRVGLSEVSFPQAGSGALTPMAGPGSGNNLIQG